MKNLYW